MKNFYSLLAAGLLTSMGASAVTGELPVGEKVYIQNVRTGLFLGGGNSWGTQGTVAVSGDLFEIEAGYKFVNQDVSATNKRLGDNLYVDNAGAKWNVVEVNPGEYTIENGGKYLMQSATAGLHGIGFELGADGSGDLWRFLTRAEAIERLKAATPANPMPATFLLSDANFNRNYLTTAWKNTGAAATVNAISGSANAGSNFICEAWKKAFDLSQTLADVPNGKYRVSAQAAVCDYNGTGEELPYLYANNEKKSFILSTSTTTMSDGEKDKAGVGESFKVGKYQLEPLEVIVTDGTLTVGFAGTNTNQWAAWDNVSIDYLGPVEDLGILQTAYTEAKTNAEAALLQPMNAQVKKALQDAMAQTPASTAASYNEVIANLGAATANAKASAKVYADVQSAYDAALAGCDEAKFKANTADVTAALTNGTVTDGVAELEAINAAKMKSLKKGTDLTNLIVNPTINGNTNGWTTDKPEGGNGPLVTNPNGTGNPAFEYWGGNASSRDAAQFNYYQKIENLPAGLYEVTAKAFNSLNGEANAVWNESCVVYANNASTPVNVEGMEYNTYAVNVAIAEGETLTIGVKSLEKVRMGARWFVADDFTLKYLGAADITMYKEQYEAAKGNITEQLLASPMNAGILAELTALKNATEPTTQEALVAATSAINAKVAEAKKSASFYKNVETVLYAKVEAAMALDAAGQASFMTSAAPYVSAGQAGELDETLDYAAMIDAAYIAAVKAQGPGADMTGLMSSWVGSTNTYGVLGVPERWNKEAYTGDVMTQTISGLQAGEYTVKVKAAASTTQSRDGEASGHYASAAEAATVLFANDATIALEVGDRIGVTAEELGEYELTAVVGADGVLTFGIKNEDVAGNWFLAQNVSLTYNGAAAPTYAINISCDAATGIVIGESGNYKEGEKVSLGATPAPNYEFAGWYEGTKLLSTEKEFTYTVGAADANIVAKFTKVATYAIAISATEGGTASTDKTGEYAANTKLLLSATADAGYNFVGWYNGTELVSSEASFKYTVGKAPANLVAKFEKIIVNFDLALSATEGGSVFGDGQFAEGTTVTIDAVADEGYDFVGWFSGDLLITKEANYAFELKGNMTLTAKFEEVKKTPTFAVNVSSYGYATFTGDKAADFSETPVKAYIATAASGNSVTLTKVNQLAAGQGALLVAVGGSYDVPEATATVTAPATNYFVGTLTDIVIEEKSGANTNCYLTTDKNGANFGFYVVEGTQAIGAGKSYLSAPLSDAAASSIKLIFEDEDPTSVEVIETSAADAEGWYTLGGVKVNKPAKGGIYVHGGKVLIVK